MWEDSRDALKDLDLQNRKCVLDVGCGTGEFTNVLREECAGTVVGLDVDRSLLAVVGDRLPVILGDAHWLPFPDNSVDLVVCQGLLVNVTTPAEIIDEFSRVSSDIVAAIEADNEASVVSSTVTEEPSVLERVKSAYIEGARSDPAIGPAVADYFHDAGLTDIQTRQYDHEYTIEPPYDEADLAAARKAATGAAAENSRRTLLEVLSYQEFDTLRTEWRAMGRSIVEAMQSDEYRRTERIPFYVTVGRV